MSRIVVVTGGASGVGETIVNRLASTGDLVVVADADELRGRQVADNLTAAGMPAESETVDVTSEGEVAAMFDAIAERHGRLDAIVCAAEVDSGSAAVDGEEDWPFALDVNVRGPFFCCKHGIPAIAGSGGGAVVLVGSRASSASAGALADLAKQAAIEHAAQGVRVNLVTATADDTDPFARVATTVALLCSNGTGFANGTEVPLA